MRRRWSSVGSVNKLNMRSKDSMSLESLLSENGIEPEIIMYENGLVNLSDSSFDDQQLSTPMLRTRKTPEKCQTDYLSSLEQRRMSELSPKMYLEDKFKGSSRVKRTQSFVPSLCETVPELADNYIKIPKTEYEQMQNKIAMLEKRYSHDQQQSEPVQDSVSSVQNKYEKTLEEANIESISSTDQLARRLSKDLKIRRSSEQRVFRSPSARRIGSIRRRSQERMSR